MVRAVVASLGSDERMMDADRFSGILDGASEGIVSVIAATSGWTQGPCFLVSKRIALAA